GGREPLGQRLSTADLPDEDGQAPVRPGGEGEVNGDGCESCGQGDEEGLAGVHEKSFGGRGWSRVTLLTGRRGRPLFFASCPPEADGLVVTAGGEAVTLRGEGDTIDRAVVPFKDRIPLPGGRVPEPERPVLAARDQQPAVRREGQGGDGVVMAVEGQ